MERNCAPGIVLNRLYPGSLSVPELYDLDNEILDFELMRWDSMKRFCWWCNGMKMLGWCISQLGLPNQSTTNWVTWTTEMIFLTILDARSLQSKYWQGFFFSQGPVSLAYRCLSLSVSFHSLPFVYIYAQISTLYKDTSHVTLGPVLRLSI